MQIPYDPAWYIVYTKPTCEKKVIQHLERKKIAHYYPMNRTKKQQNNRVSVILKPLFPSYVFVHTHTDMFHPIKKINGVLSMVHRLKDPATISGEEIKQMKNFLTRYDNVLTEKISDSFTHLSALAGDEIIQQEDTNYFVKLSLPSMGSVLKASIGLESVKPTRVLLFPEEYQAFTSKIAN